MMTYKGGLLPLIIATTTALASPGFGKDIDWKQASGTEINVLLISHQFVDALRPLLPQFEEKTGIRVNLEVLAEQAGNEKILADLSSRAGLVDVFMTSPLNNWQYATAGWIEPLDPYLADSSKTDAETYKLDDFFPGVLSSNRWTREPLKGIGEGDLWALPINTETYMLAYRPGVFAELGLTAPKTYAELLGMADKLDKGSAQYGMITRFDTYWDLPFLTFGTMLQSYGVEMLDKDGALGICSDASVQATDDFVTLVKTASPAGAGAFTWYEALQGFSSGQYALSFNEGDLFAPVYEDPEQSAISDDVAYAPTPLGPTGERKAGAWIWALSMNAASGKKDASWLFLEWATLPETMIATHLAGNMNPVRASAWADPKVAAMVDSWGSEPGQYRKTVETMEEVAAVRFPPHPELTRALDRWASAVQEVYFKGTDTRSALCAAQDDIKGMLGL